MFDPFGTRRKLVVNTKNFQKNLALLKDFKDLIGKIDGSGSLDISLERRYEFCSLITLHLSAPIFNEGARYWLNEFSYTFYKRKYPFMNDKEKESRTNWLLQQIQNELSQDNDYHLLYQKLVKSGHIDPCEFVTNNLGISENYVLTNEDLIIFSKDLILKTCFLNSYRNGHDKDRSTLIGERNFYFKLLLEELNKL